MKTVTLYFWDIPNAKGRLKRSLYRMSEADAKAKHPDAVRIDHDSVTIEQPENEAEAHQAIYTRATSYRKP